jgi:hypothetical protein
LGGTFNWSHPHPTTTITVSLVCTLIVSNVVLHYYLLTLASSNTNYIIFRNVEIFPKKKKINLKKNLKQNIEF